ncbi:3-oxoacyl-[acyl-carrier-protein] synthase [hydrothermal vent metagenome]|uniref:Nodulation protein E n=1 Tax=hydrothermal vent metagenome TaxID=652676 RepID=A0A3B1D7C0_9ZZZZ
MLKTDPVIVDYNMITSYGMGVDICWEGLLKNQSAIKDIQRFDASHFHAQEAAIINDIFIKEEESLVMQMLTKTRSDMKMEISSDTDMILTSLNGEIDFLEQEVLSSKDVSTESRLDILLDRSKELFGVKGKAMLISAACASSGVAIARAASMIKAGQSDSVLVVSCDCVSEFLVAGFSSLMALDKDRARPFDKNRRGLTIGEAAAYVLILSRERADKEQRKIIGNIRGWGLSCDAHHMTGPAVDGKGLVAAIERALSVANISQEDISNISAHGTGTVYNDSMEMKAFKKVFKENNMPTYSIKGGLGHTMGAAGMIDLIIALKTLEANVIPPTVGVVDIADDAKGWISSDAIEFEGNKILSTNSGFGGMNAALIITV